MARPISALIYHDVVDRDGRDGVGFPGSVAGVYKLERDRFRAHLDAIADTGRVCGLLADGADVLLTFDDGGASAPWVAEQLELRGWRGAFFVITERVDTPGFMSADEVRSLHRAGHEIGSHSNTHPPAMARLPVAAVQREWRASAESLGELLGDRPRSAAVPGGSLSDAVIAEAAAAGYEVLYTSTPGRRPRRRHGITVVGRNTIWARDSPQTAAALVRGDSRVRTQRWVSWQVRAAARRVAPGVYVAVRRRRARASA